MSHSFYSLTPDRVLDAVELSLSNEFEGARLTGRATALNSIENRVYEIELEGKIVDSVVAKFYRPERWTAEQILEEHEFLRDLHLQEIPVVEALELTPKFRVVSKKFSSLKSLGKMDNGIFFSLFKKIRARNSDELSEEKLLMVGRFLARLHSVGGTKSFEHRRSLSTQSYGFDALDAISRAGFLEEPIGDRYYDLTCRLLETIEPMMEGVPQQRIHGDCHLGNLLWVQDAPIFVDFDDSLMGPVVQDLWMIAHNRDARSEALLEIVLKGYEEFREFPRETLHLMEPLRALRLIHYSSWIAKRWEDPSFPKMFPHFGGEKWWIEEIEALSQIETILQDR